MDEYCKRSGQIPTFGDWDNANELPITQYFECARQAGLIRYSSSSSGETDHHPYVRGDLYAVDFNKPSRFVPSSRKTTRERAGGGVREREREKRYNNNNNHHRHPQLKEQKKVKAAHKVCDVTEPSTKTTHTAATTTIQNDAVPPPPPPPPPPASKPIDEDLYKIPPELLLHTSKRKKILGFFSRCLAPACAA